MLVVEDSSMRRRMLVLEDSSTAPHTDHKGGCSPTMRGVV
jgi:hypothetical protein